MLRPVQANRDRSLPSYCLSGDAYEKLLHFETQPRHDSPLFIKTKTE